MIYYIGGFPPPYGGVTVKNRDLFEAISKKKKIKKIDLNKIKKINIIEMMKFLFALLNRKSVFIVGVAEHSREKLHKMLYVCNRTATNRSLVFIMGGTASTKICRSKEYKRITSSFKRVYVETIGMKKKLEKKGLKNIDYYPNCRFKPYKKYEIKYNVSDPLNVVFFSLIQPMKGVDDVIEAAKLLPEIQFSFYGSIEKGYQEQFLHEVEKLNNVVYHGLFNGKNEDTYNELSKYDVLLFPTKWDTEGVPGILVEAKIAGLACVVSNKSYNSELIVDSEQGIVLKENNLNSLVQALKLLDSNRKLLYDLKRNNQLSSEKFFIETYLGNILKNIKC